MTRNPEKAPRPKVFDDLALSYLAAKKNEAAAKLTRLDYEEAIVELLGGQQPGTEGTAVYASKNYRVTVTRKKSRKVDADIVEALCLDPSYDSAVLAEAFPLKPTIDIRRYRAAVARAEKLGDAKLAAGLAAAVTASAAKPALKVEPITP